jgi:hypothetical protein
MHCQNKERGEEILRFIATVWRFEKPFPEIPPGLPFPKGGVVLYGNSLNNGAFSSFEKEG